MNYKECAFYHESFSSFDGCPGLDFQGDDDQCGDCPYRLENFKRCLQSTQRLREYTC